MEKKLVVFLGKADWAGSCNSVCRAINQAGQIECRHVSLNKHIFGYPSDVVIPICYTENPGKAADYPKEYRQALELFERADLIHLWNDPLPAFKDLLPVPSNKVKSNTFTGTLFRENHTTINRFLKQNDTKLVVQNPTYRYPDEWDAEFIPHAVDISLLKPIAMSQRDSQTIGCYRPKHQSTTAHGDITMLEDILINSHPGWRITLDRTMPWEERMRLMPKCMFFFEYMDPNMGYWGRSALEACAMGVPTLSYVSQKACEMSMERFGEPAIIHVTHDNFKDVLHQYLTMEPDVYRELSEQSRHWIEKHYSFDAIGKHYSNFFNTMLKPAAQINRASQKLTISSKPESIYINDRTVRNACQQLGRNEPCHCGSGKKYKRCCLNKDASPEKSYLTIS